MTVKRSQKLRIYNRWLLHPVDGTDKGNASEELSAGLCTMAMRASLRIQLLWLPRRRYRVKWRTATNCVARESCILPLIYLSLSTTIILTRPPTPRICFERPQMYGLLECQHVFCLNCIKLWRSAKDKTDEQKDLSAFAGCPTCRHKTAVVIPSTIYFGNGTEKDNITRSYKESRARIECRHFQDNLPRLFCPFGTDCLYKHTDPDTGLAHVFEHSHMDTLEQSRRRRHRRAAEDEYLSERELRRILSRFFRGHSRSAGANGLDPIDHLEELAMLDALEEARLDYEYDYDEDEDEEVMMSDGDSWATEEEEGAEGVDEDEEGSEWEHESDFSVE